jgi:hypothetical protein
LTAGAVSAAPIVDYNVLVPTASNELTVVQVQGSPTCPSFGAGNCLTNGPLAVDAASVTLDLGTSELLDLSVFVGGPGIIELSGFNGYERVVFTDAAFQSSGTATLGSGGSFFIGGTVTAGRMEIFLAGNLGVIPDIVILDYTTAPNPNFAAGTVGVSGDQVTVSVNGLDLGSFPDPLTGNLVSIKADFGFVAAVPEPNAAFVFGAGILLALALARRLGEKRREEGSLLS